MLDKSHRLKILAIQILILGLLAAIIVPGLAYASRPVVVTLAATSITDDGATLNGMITDDDGKDITIRGFVWDSVSHITNPGNTAPASSGYANSYSDSGNYTTGTFSHAITNLEDQTVYYVRAFAKNSDGYSYGSEVSFTTLEIPTRWEYSNTGDDSYASIYGANWYAQTFTTTSVHTVRYVSLRLFRANSPGNLTVSIKKVSSSHPYGQDLTSVLYDCNSITTDTAGAWYNIIFDYEINLVGNETYAIVCRATDGDATNYVGWRYDSTGTYAEGNKETSANSGGTWTSSTAEDFMFEVWGVESLKLYGFSISAFASVAHDGDLLIVGLYKATTPPAFPGENPKDYLYFVLGNGTDEYAKTPVPAWGYKPFGIYLSKAQKLASGITWGGNYTISIEAVNGMWANPPSTSYVMSYLNWVGSDLFYLDSWVRQAALYIEAYYEIDCYTEEIPVTDGVKTLPSGQGVLTLTGGEIFNTGIPNLSTIRPMLFYIVVQDIELHHGTHSDINERSATWQEKVGPEVADYLEDAGGILNLNGRIAGGMILFAGWLGLSAVGFAIFKNPVPAMALSIPALFIAMDWRLLPFQLIAVIGSLILLLFVWYIWWSRT